MVVKLETYKGYTIKILIDEDPEDPRGWDNVGTIVSFHSKYNFNENSKHDIEQTNTHSWQDIENKIHEAHDPFLILPLYLYDHSGIALRTSPFNDRWDSAQVGFVFATNQSIKERGHPDPVTEELVTKMINDEIDTLNHYLIGDSYGYQILETCKCCGSLTVVDDYTLFGFNDIDYAMAEARSHIDSINSK